MLLRRHKANLLSKALEEAPPPPRRTIITPTGLAVSGTTRVQQPIQHEPLPSIEQSTRPEQVEATDDFNGALYSMKAFGYATFLVMTGALTTVWGVKSYMGVENVNICLYYTNLSNHNSDRGIRDANALAVAKIHAWLDVPATSGSNP
jgi:hypothetical protein